ncbi:MAG: molybdopterin-dependent oxidoreductase [Eubacteriales bacterium]|nr:molybdopterin-dependent oxidoreductase [Eubacteriales bacterium]
MKEFSISRKDYKSVGKSVPKKDSDQLLLGKPVYVDDITPQDALVVKLLRSPHANAMVESVNTAIALKVPGIVAVYTWEDVPKQRFAVAGQTYVEPSPYDRLILDRHVRSVGDPVAIVAGENEKAVDKALKTIKVKYEVLEPVLDFRTALDNPVLVHPEEDWEPHVPDCDNKRNLIHHEEDAHGDVDGVLADCDIVIDHKYTVKAVQQGYMETFRAYCEIDRYGRLHCISSTQIVFHLRRILARALGIPKSKVRAEKPRIGGGFGAKQTASCEIYPAFVTWKTKRPSKIIYTREECMTIASPRHEMEVHVRLGADNDGHIRAIDMHTLSNGGAYGEHSTTTVGLSGHKSLPLYTGGCEATRFIADVVYTNVQAAGAYRGYGATQGVFAVESAVNELAEKLCMDPVEIRLKNMVREGMFMPAYFGETANACSLDRCLMHCADNFNWKEKYPVRDMGNGKIRTAGVALAMQGSCISNLDVGSCTLKLSDDGTYNMLIGAADMGTGCDTILAQMAAEVLECDVDRIAVFGADTDASPYDSGSYASSTTYITGMATVKAANELRERICRIGADMLGLTLDEVEFDGEYVYKLEEACGSDNAGSKADKAGAGSKADKAKPGETANVRVSLSDIAFKAQLNNDIPPEATAMHKSPVSPPPYMAGMVEIELDKETGSVEVLDYQAVVDCGIPVNPNLARVQTEGGIGQGIGMALSENVTYNEKGQIAENSFMQYKMPTRIDVGNINVEFETSYEPTGPFGVKSIGEIVINTPAPALQHAIYRATGVWHYTMPFTPEKILMGMLDPNWQEPDRRVK